MLTCVLRLLFLLSVAIAVPLHAAVILQYHHVSDTTPPATSTAPKLFKQHLEYLQKQDFQVVPLPELLADLQSGEPRNDKVVAITFDDGYDSIYQTAFPELRRHGFPFTVFINTDPLGSDGFMNWEQVARMVEHGATIANHTESHLHMVRKRDGETQSQWRDRVRADIVDAQVIIKRETGQNHKLLAYPYGEFNQSVVTLVQELGYVGLGQHSGAVGVKTDWLRVPRFPMGGSFGSMDTFATKVNTLPLPVVKKQLLDTEGEMLSDDVVAAGDRPQVRLTLPSAALASRLQCYFQGETMSVSVSSEVVTVQAHQGLSPGRARYNCTARDDESGRFHWYSQPWLVTSKEGQWVHED